MLKMLKKYADFVSKQTMEADEQIVSFDATALFTSILVERALKIVDRKIPEINEWELHARLTQSQIMFLLTFVLKNRYFTFEAIRYHQVFGCAMGSPVSAAMAELVMQEVEKIALNTSNFKPRWWKRYVDDSSACLKTKDIQVFPRPSQLDQPKHTVYGGTSISLFSKLQQTGLGRPWCLVMPYITRTSYITIHHQLVCIVETRLGLSNNFKVAKF